MHDALRAINALVANKVIPTYAIGGAIAASFYIEASATEDVDIFVVLPKSPGGLLTLDPIYDALKGIGGLVKDEHIRIGAWPVQILPAYSQLVEEALEQAVDVPFDDIPTRVMTAEHLCAICLDTGRPKDFLRVSLFIDQQAVDLPALELLLARYNLTDRRKAVPNWPRGDRNGNDAKTP